MAALALKLMSKSKLLCGIGNISARRCFNLDQHRLLSTTNIIKSTPDSSPGSRSTESIYAKLYGRDHKYWRVIFMPTFLNPDKPRLTLDLPRDEIVDEYVKFLANVLKSEEEARKKMYSVSTRHHLFFVCQIDFETAVRLLDFDRFCLIEPVSEKDLTREDYGETAEPLINGKVVEYDPVYHKAFLKNLNRNIIFRDIPDRFKEKKDQNKSGEGKKHAIQA